VSVAVRYHRAGAIIVETTIDGHLLPLTLPPTVTARHGPGRIDLLEDPDPTRECCGRLTLVTIADDKELTVQHLSVPPPPPFADHDVRAMWEARNRLQLRRRDPISGEADWSETALDPALRVRLDQLPRAIGSARLLLSRWPVRHVTRSQVLPVEQRGGREDLLATSGLGDRAGLLLHSGRLLPTRTVRRFGDTERRRCGSVSTIAELLRATADSFLAAPNAVPETSVRRRLLTPLAAVADAAIPAKGSVDEPPSTWPHVMQHFYSRAAIALTELEILGAGEDTAPLSELWELYQAWVAELILTQLENELGLTNVPRRRGALLGRWQDASGQIELHYTPTIPAKPGKFYEICGTKLHAVIGDLEPDLILGARVNATTRILIIDPKKRPFLDSGAVSVEASKYLWGIRGADRRVGVVLVAPSGGVNASHPEGLAWTVMARPSGDVLPPSAVPNWLVTVTV
jgi:hypothetical protein